MISDEEETLLLPGTIGYRADAGMRGDAVSSQQNVVAVREEASRATNRTVTLLSQVSKYPNTSPRMRAELQKNASASQERRPESPSHLRTP